MKYTRFLLIILFVLILLNVYFLFKNKENFWGRRKRRKRRSISITDFGYINTQPSTDENNIVFEETKNPPVTNLGDKLKVFAYNDQNKNFKYFIYSDINSSLQQIREMRDVIYQELGLAEYAETS